MVGFPTVILPTSDRRRKDVQIPTVIKRLGKIRPDDLLKPSPTDRPISDVVMTSFWRRVQSGKLVFDEMVNQTNYRQQIRLASMELCEFRFKKSIFPNDWLWQVVGVGAWRNDPIFITSLKTSPTKVHEIVRGSLWGIRRFFFWANLLIHYFKRKFCTFD